MLALALGNLLSRLTQPLQAQRWARLGLLLPLAAYGHALWLYDRTDFLGLSVVRGLSQQMPPRWNPYTSQQPVWLPLAALTLFLLVAIRVAAARVVQPSPVAGLPDPGGSSPRSRATSE
jgi:hypothetical protein